MEPPCTKHVLSQYKGICPQCTVEDGAKPGDILDEGKLDFLFSLDDDDTYSLNDDVCSLDNYDTDGI